MTGPLEILSTETCASCHQLKRFLDYKDIPYTVRMIDEDRETMQKIVEHFGYFITPTTVVPNEGEQLWIPGYQPYAIMEALGNQ